MEPSIVITLPADASDDLIARLAAAFPEAQLDRPTDPMAELASETEMVERALTEAVTAVPRLPDMIAAWWPTLPWGGWGLFALMAAILIGVYAVEKAVAQLVRFDGGTEPQPTLSARLPRGLLWLLWRAVLLGGFAVVATTLFTAIMRPDPAVADYFRHVLRAVIRVRAMMLIIEAIVAPGAPSRRLLGIGPEGAAVINGAMATLGALLIAIGLLRATLLAALGTSASGQLAQIALIILSGLVGAWFFLRVREPIRTILFRALGSERTAAAGILSILSQHWAWLYIGLVVLDAGVKAMGILGLLGPQAASGTGQAVLLMVLAPLGVAALRVWGSEAAGRAAAAGRPRGGSFFGALALAEGVFQLGMALLLARAWGIDPLDTTATGVARIVPRLFEAAAMLVVGIAVWQAIAAFLATRDDRAEEDLDDEQRRTRRRLATILPVVRGVALALVGVLTAMTALSALGVNIAPLLASAGVLGLAIGFGAQRLVADVISGLLYLYEDAFRIGEYIEVSGGKGAVEKISLRSVRLRHPRGPVYTIPFSAMGTVQNHSRDYATMKFSFSVAAGTDLEKVRKLVKKAGEEMLQDPEMADKIITPLKSQGAVAIQGASYQIGIKFTAKPGEQFAVRRKAFIAVSKALEENGIKLFAPQLTINAANPAAPLQPAGQPA